MYRLPRNVQRVLKRLTAPFGLSRRAKTVLAIDKIVTLVGRYHTHPHQFDKRGCGLGEDGGFHLDRRGLSGQNGKVSKGAEGLTEWSVREATALLIDMGFIVRITPKATAYRSDKNGRFGRWLEAKKDESGQIRAPGIRYKLSHLFRSLFAAALNRDPKGRNVQGHPPVGVESDFNSISKEKSGEVGVSTGGGDLMTPERWKEIRQQVTAERAAAQAPDRRAAHMADLEARRQRREAEGSATRFETAMQGFEAVVQEAGR